MLTRRQVVVSSFLALSAGGIGAAAARYLATDVAAERADCPGKIVCPITGELVCKDRCPLGAEDTDEGVSEAATPAETPSCCVKQE